MRSSCVFVSLLALLAACGDKGSTTTTSSATGASAATGAPSGAAKPAETAASDPGSVAALAERASGVMTALHRGDAKAAADFCLGKHRDALQGYIAETIEKKEQSRAKSYEAWNGKLGEMRIDGDRARVAFGEDGDRIDYLSFRKKDGSWSLDDIPVAPKSEWSTWGKVASE